MEPCAILTFRVCVFCVDIAAAATATDIDTFGDTNQADRMRIIALKVIEHMCAHVSCMMLSYLQTHKHKTQTYTGYRAIGFFLFL